MYEEPRKRELVTLVDVLCIYYKRDKSYYDLHTYSSDKAYIQLLLDTERESEGGNALIRSSLEQNLTNIHLLPQFYKAITDRRFVMCFL
ncbi:MAG: hypothetical protein J6O54_02550 [Prevotella sp.]|nr:hypothetical protein [Prevotella sp.]